MPFTFAEMVQVQVAQSVRSIVASLVARPPFGIVHTRCAYAPQLLCSICESLDQSMCVMAPECPEHNPTRL